MAFLKICVHFTFLCYKRKEMGFLNNLFNFRKKGEVEITESADTRAEDTPSDIVKWSFRYINDIVLPKVAGSNFMELFNTVPEVFFPIDYIASRIAGATFQVRKIKDDSVVWHNKPMNRILSQPNCLTSWREFVYQHHVYKMVTGNSYIRAAMNEAFKGAEKFKYCSSFWVLPSDHVGIEPFHGRKMPLFEVAEKDDLIRCYRLSYCMNACLDIPVFQIWHDRDGLPGYYNSSSMFCKAKSRLESQLKPISNLLAVYEARNVIYVKRGGLGFIISKKEDPTGTVAMSEKEKKNLLDQVDGRYGIGKGKSPYGISDIPIDFVRTNLSIKELEPFEETLADAISIAGAFGIPSVLVPRKDQSTFSNQSTAEKAVYSSKIIPMAQQFCEDISSFLGLTENGLYLTANFDHVDCLQVGRKEAEEVKKIINERCRSQFECGLITLNDWRAQIGESQVENPLFDKLKFDMSDEELDIVNRVINNTQKISEDEGRNQAPAVQD